MKKISTLLLVFVLLLSATACSGNTSKYSMKVNGEKYTIIVDGENGHYVQKSYENEEEFCIYKEGTLLCDGGLVTTGILTSAATELIKIETAEEKKVTDNAVFYAFEQYDKDEMENYTIVIKFDKKPSYVFFEFIGTLEEVQELFEVISVK